MLKGARRALRRLQPLSAFALDRRRRRLIGAAYAELASPGWRPEPEALTVLPHPAPPPEALSLRGFRAVGGLAAPIAELERLDALARAALPDGAGAVDLTPALLADLGWDAERGRAGSARARLRPDPQGRRRRGRPLAPARDAGRGDAQAGIAVTPFAALAALAKPNSAAARRARRAKARRRRSAAGAQLRDRRRLPDRRLAVARALFQDQEPRRAHRRGRRRPAHARRRAHVRRQAEPRRAPRRRSRLHARVAMDRCQGRGAGREARPGDRGARALQQDGGAGRSFKRSGRVEFRPAAKLDRLALPGLERLHSCQRRDGRDIAVPRARASYPALARGGDEGAELGVEGGREALAPVGRAPGP